MESNNDKNTMHEYCYLRYEGFTITNTPSVLDLVTNMSNEDRMYGIKLALELKSYNIASSLNDFNIFSHMNPEADSLDIKDFFLNCARNLYSINESITDKNRVTNALISLVYALERRDGFDGDKFDKAFNKYGVNVPSNIYEEVRRIFLNGKSDLIYGSSCPSMNSKVNPSDMRDFFVNCARNLYGVPTRNFSDRLSPSSITAPPSVSSKRPG